MSISPFNNVYEEGDNISLTCSAEGGPSNMLQWQLNNVNLTSETENVLNVSGITADVDGGVYTCVVTNAAGADRSSVTVNISPVITQQPVDVSAEVNDILSLECRATGFPIPTYQWFRVDGNIGRNVTGDMTSLLLFDPVVYGDEGDYYCQVTSGNITINSTTATLASKS